MDICVFVCPVCHLTGFYVLYCRGRSKRHLFCVSMYKKSYLFFLYGNAVKRRIFFFVLCIYLHNCYIIRLYRYFNQRQWLSMSFDSNHSDFLDCPRGAQGWEEVRPTPTSQKAQSQNKIAGPSRWKQSPVAACRWHAQSFCRKWGNCTLRHHIHTRLNMTISIKCHL